MHSDFTFPWYIVFGLLFPDTVYIQIIHIPVMRASVAACLTASALHVLDQHSLFQFDDEMTDERTLQVDVSSLALINAAACIHANESDKFISTSQSFVFQK